MNKYLFLSFFALYLLCGCTETTIEEIFKEEKQEHVNLSYMVEGHVRVKVTEPFSTRLSNQADTKGHISRTNVKSSDNILSSIGAKYMVRTFAPAGHFEARQRKSGLHLWYNVYFDVKTPLTKAKLELSDMEGIQMVEYRPKIIRIQSNFVKVKGSDRSASNIKRNSTTPYFDDPQLVDQWHYSNDGSRANSVVGSDINLIPAWQKYTRGDPKVIVSIVDGGIDVEHEDLKANMWINEKEIPDNGIDDDKNGRVDDKYGWDFVTNSPNIIPDDHGTHVAGTISAVNNNGIGVCGIAGGNFKNGEPGVRLMSCQIFIGDVAGDAAPAIVYGANNGAVISQNSWGYGESDIAAPESDRVAIDYFINNAGMDKNGNQVGPMKGGIVIFASGNDNSHTIGRAPGEYESAFAVSSIGADYKRAYYSNYGDWVDITAPGGDVYKNNQILSTIVGDYGDMQGTSMACPHVSGLAALIVSYNTEPGFTPDMLKEIIETSARNIDDHNPDYKGKLGKGLINANTALSFFSKIAPEPVNIANVNIAVISNNLTVDWEIPTDSDDDKAWGVNVYYSETNFTPSSLDRENLPSSIHKIKFTSDDLNAGDEQEDFIRGLEFNTKYYLAIDAYDFAGNQSSLSNIRTITTLGNNAPVILPTEDIVLTLKSFETVSKIIAYSDDDGHDPTWTFEPGSAAAIAVPNEATPGELYVIINAVTIKESPGTYTATLRVTDKYGLSTEKRIQYTVKPNNPPVVTTEFSNLILGQIEETYTYDLRSYIKDDDGEPLRYKIEIGSTEIVRISENKNILSITPLTYGITDITITATDAVGASVSTSFDLLVRDENVEIDLYPNPVIDKLNLRMGKDAEANVSIIGASGATVHSDDYSISPFIPAQIDMSNIVGGSYTVVIKYEGKEIKRNIVKL